MTRKSPFPALLHKAVPFIANDSTRSDKYVEIIADAIENGLRIEISALTLAIDICVDHLKNEIDDAVLDSQRAQVMRELITAADAAGVISMPQYSVV